jgi:hypothetical protein
MIGKGATPRPPYWEASPSRVHSGKHQGHGSPQGIKDRTTLGNDEVDTDY